MKSKKRKNSMSDQSADNWIKKGAIIILVGHYNLDKCAWNSAFQKLLE